MKLRDEDLRIALKGTMPATLNCGDGLYWRLQSPGKGRAAFLFRYKFAGTPRWMTLGTYTGKPGSMTLAQARTEARKSRVLLDKGIDPLDERRAKIQAAAPRHSFRNLAEEWFGSEIRSRVKHPEVPRRYLDKYLLPALGPLKVKEMAPADLTRVLKQLRHERPTAANDALWYAKRILDFGVRHRWVQMNPFAGLRPSLDAGGKEEPRDRALSQAELTKLFEAMKADPGFGGVNVLAVKLLLALCVRKGELFRAEWSEFDLEGSEDGPVWRLPKERTKTNAGLDIPLPNAAVDWLRALRAIGGRSEYVFPARRRDSRSRGGHVGLDTLNAALAKVEHGLESFTVHDLRRTARTHLAALGVRTEVAERCLNHKPRGIVGTYDRHAYFAERREALAQWTNLICEIESGGNKVRPIGSRKSG